MEDEQIEALLSLDDISECDFSLTDKVRYDHNGKVGFSGRVVEVRAVWIVTVKNHHGTTKVAPASHWKE